ncbi:MAG: hypothetical protein LBV72_13340 [Tannerella sp.]|nr:hypothetical protein [Tannerella sp.]
MDNQLDYFLVVLIGVAFITFVTFIISPGKKKPLTKKQLDEIEKKQKEWAENRRIELENDKERVTESEIRKLILDLKLPAVVLDFFNETYNDEAMEYELHEDYAIPYAILELTKKQQDEYLIDRYKPILAYLHSTVFAYDSKLKGFIVYDIEDKIIEKEECLTWDGIFVNEVLRWWENDISDEDILHIGNLFGLKHTKEILDSIYSTTEGKGFPTFEDTYKWEEAMIDQLNARIK